MTLIDLLVIGLLLWMGGSLWRAELPKSARRGALAVWLGVGLVALFHLADLIVMHAFPAFIGRPRAAEVMTMLHLNVRWFVTLVALGLVAFGWLRLLRDLRSFRDEAAERERQQAALIDNLPVAAALLWPDGRVARINAHGAALLLDPGADSGAVLWTLPGLTGPHAEQLETALRRAAAGETVRFNLEDSRVGPMREPAVLDVTLSPLRSEAGEVTEILATASDITTAWHAAVASAKAEERFRSLLTHTGDNVFCFEYDPPIPTTLPPEKQVERIKDGVLVECNRNFAEHHGFSHVDEILGKHQRELAPLAGAGIDGLLESFVLNHYRLEDAEIETRRADGKRRYYANNGHGVIEDGHLIRRWGSFRDITARVLAEKDLRSALQQIQALKTQLEQENVELREEVERAHGFSDIVGEDPKIERCLELVGRIAPTDAAVLILGETGTGKELIARAIHSRSQRHEQTLIKLNCAALPSELIESELFGHEKGAFTGAHTRRIGRFELANGGSLFLDEIGDLPFELQGKLLRVLQEGEFERLGGTKTLSVDVRIIAATNKDLREEVDRGAFRADLFYRINTFPVVLPPLRERRGDILLLVRHFIDKHGERFNRRIDSISPRTLRFLQQHAWPGNIRELEGFVERALIASSGPVLDYVDELQTVAGQAPASRPAATRPGSGLELREAERSHIEAALAQSNWVIEGAHGAAARLGIAPSTLRSKMKRFSIARPDATRPL